VCRYIMNHSVFSVVDKWSCILLIFSYFYSIFTAQCKLKPWFHMNKKIVPSSWNVTRKKILGIILPSHPQEPVGILPPEWHGNSFECLAGSLHTFIVTRPWRTSMWGERPVVNGYAYLWAIHTFFLHAKIFRVRSNWLRSTR